jgi:tetratricopeptide (TPR) repeat protein
MPNLSRTAQQCLKLLTIGVLVALTLVVSWHIALHRAQTAERRMHEANMLMMHGQFASAVITYDQVVAVLPRAKLAWARRGVCLLRLGRYEEALSSYDRSLRLDHDYLLACVGKGITLIQLGRSSEAVLWYDQCLLWFPDNPRLTELRSRALTNTTF